MDRVWLTLLSQWSDAAPGGAGRVSDADLLERFVRQGDSAAFELLFWRHARLVWGACQRVLGDHAEAEDAFQATFVVLARKAATIGRSQALAGWLYRVAWRTALNADKARRRLLARQRCLAGRVDHADFIDPTEQAARQETARVLDQELLRLPEKYRLPLILCYLEAQPHEAAAAALGCPLGTLNSRLARGRSLLKHRLVRRGLSLGALTAAGLPTARAAAALAAVLRTPAPAVQALATATLRSLGLAGVLKTAGAVLLGCVLVIGMAWATLQRQNHSPRPPLSRTAPKDDASAVIIDREAGPVSAEVLVRIGSTRFRHWGDVTSLTYSPDGKWLGSISTSPADRTARLWEAATGKEKLRVKIQTAGAFQRTAMPQYIPQALGFSADSKQFLLWDLASLRGFDIATGQERFAHAIPLKDQAQLPLRAPRRRGRFSDLMGAALAPDGKTLVLARRNLQGGNPGRLEIREVATGKVRCRGEHPFGDYAFVTIEFSPDSKRFAAGALGDQSVPIYDTASARGKGQVRVEGQSIAQVRFLPRDDSLAVLLSRGANGFERAIGIYDLKTGKLARTVKVDATTYCFARSPDGKLIFAGNGQKRFSQLIDVASGKEVGRVPSSFSLSTLAFSPDGRLLAAARSYSGAISVYDIPARRFHPRTAEPVSFFGTRFSSDGRTLLFEGGLGPTIDWRTGKALRWPHVSDPGRTRRSITSPDGSRLAVADPDGTIRLVHASTGKIVRKLTGAPEPAGGMVFSADGRRLAASHWDRVIRVWDLVAGRKLATLEAPELFGADHLAISANGKVVAATCNQARANGTNIIYTWDVDAQKKLARIEAPTLFFSNIALSPDGRLVAGGGGEAQPGEPPGTETAVTLWEASTGKVFCSLKGHLHELRHPGASCEFSPDGRLLITGDSAGRLRLWEVATGQEMHRFEGHRTFVMAHFSPDGRLLVAASEDAPCFLWDVTGTARPNRAAAALDEEKAWTQLAATDAKQAWDAMRRLVSRPEPAIRLLRDKLKPAVPVDPMLVAKLLGDLEAKAFARRAAATAELTKLAERIKPQLEKACASASLEGRRRLEHILETMPGPTPERLRESRAILALEWMGTPAADRLLAQLAGGAPGDPLTQAAAMSQERLRRRGLPDPVK
jgi:RNA polymerase sigma factor (sigma-70 family)